MLKENLLSIYADSFKDHWSLPALTDYITKETMTYGDFAKAVAYYHLLFEQLGIQPGDKIALMGKNTTTWVTVFMSTITYGAVIVPVLQEFNPRDAQHIINHSDADLLFVSNNLWETFEFEKMPKLKAALSLEGNFARRLDIAVFGENHIYHGYGIPFDPEGLLGVLTGTCTVLIGYLIGRSIRNSASKQSQDCVSARTFVISAGLLLAGLALSIVIPINKPLWSVSYVFYAAGWASFVLALLIYLIDYKGWEKPFFPFKALGMNALALYVLSALLMVINWRYIGWDYTAVFGSTKFLSLVFALLYMLLHLAIAVIMYKKKIFIKL